MPVTPPPMTRADGRIVTSMSSRGTSSLARATAPRARRTAFSVASSLSVCDHAHCSLMFTCSKRYRFRPSLSRERLTIRPCMFGEHAATATLSSPLAEYSSLRNFCPSLEQRASWTKTSITSGSSFNSFAINSRSICFDISPLQPHRKTMTPFFESLLSLAASMTSSPSVGRTLSTKRTPRPLPAWPVSWRGICRP